MAARFDLGYRPATYSPVTSYLNLIGLGLLVWGTASEAQPGLGGRHLLALVMLVAASGSWVGWIGSRTRASGTLAILMLGTMVVSSGVLLAFAPTAVVFVAVGMLGTGLSWEFWVSASVAAAGLVATVCSAAAFSPHGSVIVYGIAAIVTGMVLGYGRRQSTEKTEQAILMQVEKDKAQVERDRAELLAERNHLARELHDVLAHTLAALSLQLEAFDTVVGSDPSASAQIRDQLEKTKTLVHEGLDEARGAVQALRENAVPLEEQLAKLSSDHHAAFAVKGTPRLLSPQMSLGLYRATQEALTNVVKHAPGAPTTVELSYTARDVSLRVENGAGSGGLHELAGSGGGFGLQGIRERLTMLGGQVEAGPCGSGWRIAAVVPAPS